MEKLTISGYSRRIPHLVAQEKGFFAAQDLDVDFHRVTLAPEHNEDLAAGRQPLTLSSADTMIARTTRDGHDFILFLQSEEGLAASIVAQPGFTRLEELKGKLFAGDPGDSNLDLIRGKMMRTHGVHESEYDIDILGATPERAEAFLAKKVDAAILTPPSLDKVIAAGGVLLANASDYVPCWPLTCGWGLRSWVESHRDQVVRFTRAMAQGADWALDPANTEETLAILMEIEGQSRPRAEAALGRVVPHCRIDRDAIQAVIDLRIEMDVYDPPHDPPERFFDMSYWEEATGQAVA